MTARPARAAGVHGAAGCADNAGMPPGPDDVEGGATPRGPASWSDRFGSTPGPESPFHTPPPSTTVLRVAMATQLVLLVVVAGVPVAGLLSHHGVVGRVGYCAVGVVLVGWRWFMFRNAWRALARRRSQTRLTAAP